MNYKKDVHLIDWLIVAAIFALVIGAWIYFCLDVPMLPVPKIIGHSSDV